MSDEREKQTRNATSIREQVEERRREAEEYLQTEEKKETQPRITSRDLQECLDANESGAGRLVAAIGKGRYIKNFDSERWLRWNGQHWEHDTEGFVHELCEEAALYLLDESEKLGQQIGQAAQDGDNDLRKRLEARRAKLYKRIDWLRSWYGQLKALAFASIVPGGLGIPGKVFDSNGWILPCPNVVIDLRTGGHRDGRRDDYATIASPVDWKGIDEPAETWDRTLLGTFGDNQELVDFFQRLCGLAIIGEHLESIFAILYGPGGRNGKSLITEIIRWVLGFFATPVPSELFTDQGRSRSSSGPSPDIMLLKGLRVAFGSETKQQDKLDVSQIKWLTGGDTVIARGLQKDFVSFEPSHTLFLLTNHKPHAPAEDHAFWSRALLIPFEMSFVDREPQAENERRQDKNLKQKLRNEASGILAWLVRGCLEYQAKGLQPPPIVKQATTEYRKDEDTLADFISEECIVLDSVNDGHVPAGKLYERFVEWYRSTVGIKAPSGTWFGKNMARRFHRDKKNGIRCFFGIKLT
jgi:putative DNA primase/helicase